MGTSPLALVGESRSWCIKGGSKRNSNLSICLVRRREGNSMMRKGHSLLALWRERSMCSKGGMVGNTSYQTFQHLIVYKI